MSAARLPTRPARRPSTRPAAGQPARRQRYRRRRQTPTTVLGWPPYTMCRRASNNVWLNKKTEILCWCYWWWWWWNWWWWQFIGGGNLEQLISDKLRELSWPVRIRLACDVAKGLKYVHSRGIMHRDLTSKVHIATQTRCVVDMSSFYSNAIWLWFLCLCSPIVSAKTLCFRAVWPPLLFGRAFIVAVITHERLEQFW